MKIILAWVVVVVVVAFSPRLTDIINADQTSFLPDSEEAFALFPIISVGLVVTLAQSLIAAGGKLFDFEVGTELTTLLTVVRFGIGTDYILFCCSASGSGCGPATSPGRRSRPRSSGSARPSPRPPGVVIIAFSAMLLASLGFFATLGPSLAVALAIMLLAALTLSGSCWP